MEKKIDKISQYIDKHGNTISYIEKLFQLGNSTLSRIITEDREISENTLRKMRKNNPVLYGVIFGESQDLPKQEQPIGVPDRLIGVLEKQVGFLEARVSSLEGQILRSSLRTEAIAQTNQETLAELLGALKKLSPEQVEKMLSTKNVNHFLRLKAEAGIE